jgi:hypothetical protein
MPRFSSSTAMNRVTIAEYQFETKCKPATSPFLSAGNGAWHDPFSALPSNVMALLWSSVFASMQANA